MGGKTSQTTQAVSIPPEVLARYNAVNARAEEVAQRPFQQYGSQFVAPLTGTQQAGIAGTGAAANLAQPFYGMGAGMTLAGAQNVGPLTQGQIAYYENPYLESVARPTYQALRQQQQQEMAGQTANAIRSGAFGGDRAGLVAANLARQQQLGTAQAMAPIYAQGYGQAVQTAAGQQGVVAQDLARQMAAGQQLAGLGTGAQQAALQGAQAQLAAGTAEQQTQQADLTARYNQFLQEQGYPFQVAQFLANIAMGTGALSGSTTTTTQPSSFFSDRRLKNNVEEIGKLKDGQKLYRYTMADGRTHIGLMADEVEKHHPDAVGLAGGYKTVDYRAATDDAARHKKAYGGGLAPSSEGGAVMPDMAGMGFARGGDVEDIRRMLTMHREMYPYGHIGLYGNPDQRKGPYSTTMREINIPSRPLAPTTTTMRPLNYAADVPYGVAQYAAGGVAGYAQGGLPYSEASDEYVPEDISKPMTPASMKPAGGATGSTQDPTVADLMRMGRMAASLYSGMPFASGGVVPRMADGGYMDLDRVLAMQQQMYGSMGRPSGLNIPMSQTRDYEKSMAAMRPGAAPAAPKSGMQEALETYGQAEKAEKMASGMYEAGSKALFGSPAAQASGSTPTRPASRGLVGMGGNLNMQQSYLYNPSEILPEWMRNQQSATGSNQYQPAIPGRASGGVAGRLHYQNAGYVPSERELELENQLRSNLGVPQIVSSPPPQPSTPEGTIRIVNPDAAPVEATSGQNIPSSATTVQNTQTPTGVAGSRDFAEENAARAAAARRAGEVIGAETPSIADRFRGLFPSLYPTQTRMTSELESQSQSIADQQQSLEAARRADRAIMSQRRLQASRDLARARISGNLDAISSAQSAYDEALRAERQFIEQNPPVRNEPAPQIPDADLSGRPPSGTNRPPAPASEQQTPVPSSASAPARTQGVAGRQAPALPAPIEVGPVPGQGRPDVTEEAQQPLVMQPAQAGPTGVAPSTAQQPPSQETMAGGSGVGGLLGAAASENFLVPLLTGLGAMASSPSRYFGSALLQGLGAGAQAYEGVQSKNIERQKAYAEIANKSYNPDMNAFMVYDENNQIVAIPANVFQKNIRQGVRYRFAPYLSTPSSVAAAPISQGTAVQGAGTGQVSQAPQIKTVPSGSPLWSGLTPDQADRAKSVAEKLISNNRAFRPEAYTPEDRKVMSPYADIQNDANVVNKTTPDVLKFVGTLADLGNKDMTGSAVMTLRPYAEFYNSFVGALGFPNAKIYASQLGDMEAIDKSQTALAAQMAAAGDQRSAASLQKLFSANPGNLNSPAGRATIAAGALIQIQRAKDLQAYATAFKQAVQNETGSTMLANLSGENLESEFSKSENAKYNIEAQSLARMMTDQAQDGTSMMSYIIKNAPNLTDNMIKAIEGRYGTGIMRYFSR